jgi:hypothetical protein
MNADEAREIERSWHRISGQKQAACWATGGVELNNVMVGRRVKREAEGAQKLRALNFVSLRSKPLMILIALSESVLLFQRARRANRPRPQCVWLRVDSTQLDGVSYPRNCQHVCRDAVVDAVRIGEMHDILKRFAQNELQLFVDR